MGWPMAANLVKAGFDIKVFDNRAEQCEIFVQKIGGGYKSNLSDSIRGADVVISMLPTSKVLQTVLADVKVEELLEPNSLIIDMCSGVPSETQVTAQILQGHRIHLLDAPVSGGVRRAITGELAIVVGGEEPLLNRVTPILLAMGRSVKRTGEVGSAHAAKALNNLAQAGSLLIALEALLIGKKFGLNAEALVDFFNESSGMNYNTQIKFKQYILSGTYAAGFSIGLLAKDVGIATGLAQTLKADVPFSALCEELWTAASETLGPQSDHTEIAKVAAMKAGVDLP
jgi:3-hydroxyisobutyrate dehydrogenase